MGRKIDKATIERVRDAADIVSLVGSMLTLKRSGRSFKGLCPFHDEKTPSFHVFPDSGRYKCFGCGQGGNAVDFVMENEKVDFAEAIRILADRTGVRIEYERNGTTEEGPSRSEVYRVNDWAARYFSRALTTDAASACRAYLDKRGIDAGSRERFRIGYAPGGWNDLVREAQRRGIREELLLASGLVIARDGGDGVYDRFRDRLVFPIIDASDRVIAFGARSLDGSEPKYLNSPETPIFSKGRCLYGLDVLRHEGGEAPIFVMEGYTDVVMAWQNGCRTAVATLGTSLTEHHARLLARFNDRVTLVFDGDAPGRKAAERGIAVFGAVDLDLRVTVLPGDKDPCDHLLERGPAGVQDLESCATDFFEFLLKEIAGRHDLESVNGKVRAVDELVSLCRSLANPVKRSLVVDRIADFVGVDRDGILRRFDDGKVASAAPSRRSPAPAAPIPEPEVSEAQVPRAGRIAESRALTAILSCPELASRGALLPEDFEVTRYRRLLTTIAGLVAAQGQLRPSALDAELVEPEDRRLLDELLAPSSAAETAAPDWVRQFEDLLPWFERRRRQRELARTRALGDDTEKLRRFVSLRREGQPRRAEAEPPAAAAPPAREIRREEHADDEF